MANIKGIKIQLGADTTELTSALKKVNSEIRNTQSDLREVTKLLKFDGGNSDLLVQQQKNLASAIESTKEKLKQEQEALKQLQSGEQNSNTIKQQEALTREIEKTKQSLNNLQSQYKSFGSVDIQKHEASIKKLNEQLNTTKDRLKTVGEALKLDPGNTELLADLPEKYRHVFLRLHHKAPCPVCDRASRTFGSESGTDCHELRVLQLIRFQSFLQETDGHEPLRISRIKKRGGKEASRGKGKRRRNNPGKADRKGIPERPPGK